MVGRVAGVVGVSTAARFTRWVGFTAAELVDPTPVGYTRIDFTTSDSTTGDFTIAGFSSAYRSHIPGGAITRTLGVTITSSLLPAASLSG